jgi:hypothetical protein
VRALLPIALFAAYAAGVAGAEKVEVLRDEYGVAHIFAASAAGAAYASGYLQASERAEQLARHLESEQKSDGEAARRLPADLLAVIEAYCAGVNAAGARTIDPAMVVAYSRTLKRIEGRTVVLAADRTASRAPIFILDPIEDYADPSYPMVISGGGYNWAGPTPVGLPFPLIGHGFESIVGPADIMPGDSLLERVWKMQTQAHVTAGQALGSSQADRELDSLLHFNNGITIYDAIRAATSDDVYGAEWWQKRIAAADSESEFARMLTGWSRRLDFNSRAALGFYLFKLALGPDDSRAVEPPDSISDNRIRAAVARARERSETQFPFQATYGTLFRIGNVPTYPVSGGTVAEAGLWTPRAIDFKRRGDTMIGVRGQAATQVIELIKPSPKSFMMIPFTGSAAKFAQGEMQPTYFGNRKELEKHVKSRRVIPAP